ncbi:MAG: two-component regulator propeller domain-containing protein [Prolixibacteraceae bacterium]
MNSLREVFLITLLLSLRLICFGENVSFSRLSVENGLSNNNVKAIYKDSFGFIWIGTLEGLDRYDGVEIRPYASKFPETVENVYAIIEDENKRLWVGTSTGLFCYSRLSDTINRVNIDSTNVTVHALSMMLDGNLGVATANGLYMLDIKSMKSTHYQFAHYNNKANNLTGIFPDKHGNCWLSTLSGLIRFSTDNQKSDRFLFSNSNEESFNSFTSICNIGNKIFLGTSSEGIVEFDLSSKTFSSGLNTGNKIILTVSSDNKERLFVGTDGGGLKIINVRTQQIESIEKQENNQASISSNSVYSFFLDDSNRYWIGTYSSGINYIQRITGNFKLHPVTSKYPEANKSIRSFYFSPDGSQYFGTRNGFIVINKKGDPKFFQSSSNDKNGLRSNIILSVFPFKGDVLIGTYGGGISRFSAADQKIKPFLESSVFLKGNTYRFVTDIKGDLWIASFNGIYKYSDSDNSMVNFNSQNCGIGSDEIFELAFDSKGRLWVGTMSGVYLMKPEGNKLVKVDLPDLGIKSRKINYIYEDQVGNIWICTERGGLVMLDQSLAKRKIYRDSDGLSDNSVCAIIESSTGEYWISTLKGFCKFSIQTQRFNKYTLSDGLPSLAFTPATTLLSRDGTLYFGNENGLIYFSPADVAQTAIKSKIRLTDFYLFGKTVQPGPESVLKQSIETTEAITLNDRSNSIGFRFVAFNYINPADNDYQYKLEGFDKDWRSNGSRNTVFYEKLNPGNYTFRVRNAEDSDPNSANNLSVSIMIRPSIMKSPYFILALFLLLLGGIWLVMKYIRKLQKDGRKLLDMPQKSEKYKGLKIPDNESSRIIFELKKYMAEERPYLNAELKLADLAHAINYPAHEISQVLNQDLNQSFYDFVNRYRIEEVKKRMVDKAYEKFTFIAIAEQCGFNSKTSFYRIFKNETGKTPADYLKELKHS